MLEIEIKSLLGSEENATKLKHSFANIDPNFKEIGAHKQLNHYFTGATHNTLTKLSESLRSHLNHQQQQKLNSIIKNGKDLSVRTRQADDRVLAVIKASIDHTTSSNGISRIEFEEQIKNLTLNQLDQLVLDAGMEYQAKWSRERQEFIVKNVNVTIDKNAGYGYLAEFEKVVDHDHDIGTIQKELRALMNELGVQELPQDRLQRMFDYYNENWRDYYGTDKIFNIE